MKKYLSYILILIAFVGLFSLTTNKHTSAQSPLGYGPSQTPTPTPATPSDPLGTCTVTQTNPMSGGNTVTTFTLTHQSCTDKEIYQGKRVAGVISAVWDSKLATNSGSSTNNGALPGATSTNDTGSCAIPASAADGGGTTVTASSDKCKQLGGTFTPVQAANVGANSEGNSAFVKAINDDACISLTSFSFGGCAKQFFYYVIYTPSAIILAIAAKFFNALISLALNSYMISGSAFVPAAWAVVRDLSNIFFILVLLYAAISMILDLGGHDVKQTIAKVIIVALLINFSMFFTQVVIDSSNVLALIFYNKLELTTKDASGKIIARPYDGATGSGEKDISGGMYNGFDPTTKMDQTFWEKTKQSIDSNGKQTGTPATKVPAGTMIGIILIAAAVMLTAAYAFFISGIAFVARMIELWILIIFSPFAFMSSTVPAFAGTEYIGWKDWSTRLLKVAFMAPIFMFFMYLIFLMLGTPIFASLQITQTTWVQTIMLVVIPAAVILVLLIKATEYAKKGSGVIGEKLMQGAKMVGGLALGAATGGAAIAGRATVGRAGAAFANSEWAKEKERQGKFGAAAFNKMASGVGSASFDARAIKVGGKSLASTTGMNLGEAQKGGFTERKKEAEEKRVKRAKELQVGDNDPLKKTLNKTEEDLQGLLSDNAEEIEALDKAIETKRQEVADAKDALAAAPAGTMAAATAQTDLAAKVSELDDAKSNKKDFRNGNDYRPITSAKVIAKAAATAAGVPFNAGGNINDLEKQKREQTQSIKTENVRRNQEYADTSRKGTVRALNFILTGGAYTKDAADKAAHNIIMETKLDSGAKH